MKRTINFLLAGFLVVFVLAVGRGMVVKYNDYLVNEDGLTYSKNYDLDLDRKSIDNMAFTLICSSVAYATNTFTDGQASTGTITVSSSPIQGIPGEFVCISSICISDGDEWNHDVGGASTGTALSIANAINNHPVLSQLVIATAPYNSSIVYTTAVVVGMNFDTYSSSQAALTLDGSVTTSHGTGTSKMRGGAASSYNINSPFIKIASHGLTTGLAVRYDIGTVNIGGLTNHATYYVIPVTANAIALARTSTGAVSGSYVTFTSSAVPTSTHTYTLTPLAFSGNTTFEWDVSNDAEHWVPYTSTNEGVAISSLTISTYYSTGTIHNWDFGDIGYRHLRLAVTSPTAGGVKIKVIGNGKNTSQ